MSDLPLRAGPSGPVAANAGGGIQPPAGQIDGTAADPLIVGITTDGGSGDELTIGTIEDGKYLKRVGSTVIGVDGAASISPAFAATTGNIALTGAQTVDGQAPSDDDLILVWLQTNQDENGFYRYNSGGAWSRDSSFDSAEAYEAILGASCLVQNGDLYGTMIAFCVLAPAVLDADPIDFNITFTPPAPVEGPVLSGADQTLLPTNGSQYIMPEDSTTADCTITMGVTGAEDREIVELCILPQADTVDVCAKDGTTVLESVAPGTARTIHVMYLLASDNWIYQGKIRTQS